DLHDAVAVFAVQALQLLDDHFGRATEHEPGIDDLFDRLLHRLADVAELAAIAVLVVARLLQDDALRRSQAAAQDIGEISPPLAHQALCLVPGVGDAARGTDHDVIGSRLPAEALGMLLVDADMLARRRDVMDQHLAEDGALLGGDACRARALSRHDDGRVRLLARPRPDRDGAELIELAFPAERLGLGPRLLDELDRFDEAAMRFI